MVSHLVIKFIMYLVDYYLALMSSEENNDDLIDRIQELSREGRKELLESMQEDDLAEYLDVRGRYMERLKEEGLIGDVPEDSPWAEYCETHPYDPMCQRIMPGEELRSRRQKFRRIQEDYLDELREHDLTHVEETPIGLTPIPGGWPRWPWWLCWRYPWLCDDDWLCQVFPWICSGLERVPDIPIPAPGPFGRVLDDTLTRMDPALRISQPRPGMEPMASGRPSYGNYPGAMDPVRMGTTQLQLPRGVDVGGQIDLGDVFGPGGFDVCRFFPQLPQCDPCIKYPWLPGCWPPRWCPPFCRHDPFNPLCRGCWGSGW